MKNIISVKNKSPQIEPCNETPNSVQLYWSYCCNIIMPDDYFSTVEAAGLPSGMFKNECNTLAFQ